MDFSTICESTNHLDLEQLRELNRRVCNRINDIHRQRQQEAAAKFSEGDLIEWTSERHRRIVQGRIKSINGKSFTVIEEGIAATRWRVSPSMCRLVEKGGLRPASLPAAVTEPEEVASAPGGSVPSFAGSW